MSAPLDNNPWFLFHRVTPTARARLFCFPYAGGGASVFRTWRDGLSDQLDVIGVQIPGRENRFRETAHSTMKPLVDQLIQPLRPYFDKPVVFFGHSMGALIAFELARTLQSSMGLTVSHLIVGGCNAPHLNSPLSVSLHQLDDNDFIDALIRLNGTPQEVFKNAELMQVFLPIIRADITLAETYVGNSDDLLTCPITILRGDQDHDTSAEAMQRWQELTTEPAVLHTIRGDHFFPVSQREEVLRQVSQSLHPLLMS